MKNGIKNGMKRIFAWAAVVLLLVTTVTLPATQVMAANGSIDVGRSDIYNKLVDAMEVKVITNTMRKCIGSISTDSVSASEAEKGNIFEHPLIGGTDVKTALWVEELTQGKLQNGSIYCWQQEDGTNILNQFASKTNMSIDEIICNGSSGRLMQKNSGNGTCNDFSDPNQRYTKDDNASSNFEALYKEWQEKAVKDNEYLPEYNELGSFNNVDGYFSYIRDFDKMCTADVSSEYKEGYTKIAKFEQSDNKLVVTNQYYRVTNDKTWDYSLTENGPRSCSGLLQRISALQKTGNGEGENKGYEDILLDELNNSCESAITGNEKKIKKALKGDDEALADLDAALNNTNGSDRPFIKRDGKRNDENGQTYQCVVDIGVDDYEVTSTDTTSDVSCSSSGAAGSLGWIVCPVLEWMGDTAEGMYNGVVKDALQVEPKLFNGEVDSGTYQGWEAFRNIANVLFIILFLVVIFSQLTGVGIDNYGIKKLLPKLIVSAILINLSYILCVVCVDLSNILGNGLQEIFDGFADKLTITNSVLTNDSSGVGATLISVAIIGVLVAGVGAAVVSDPSILLVLLVAAIGVVISILFLFILLSVREAAIVVLVVISPIAVVAYMLPNTKSLFDKWKKLFQGLLLVYPICGLLIGGGNYVSKLLLASGVGDNGFFSAITAMVVGIVPVFFIPTVLKSSFAAMGNIGAKLSGLGKTVSGRATKGIQNSEGFKNARQMGAERKTRIKAGLTKDENGNWVANDKMGRFRRFVRGGNRGMAQARAQFISNQERINRENEMMGTGFQAGLAGMESKADKQRTSDYESLIYNGKVFDENNNLVNANDVGSLSKYYKEQMARYAIAETNNDRTGMAEAMAQIKAAQNILSKTDGGRAAVQNNLEEAVRKGQTSGLANIANHLMSEHGNIYKSVNRGAHAMISDLATTDLNDASKLAAIQGKLDKLDNNGNVIASGGYSMAGTAKYTEESLAGADDQAIQRLVDSVNNGSLQGGELDNIQATAYRALYKQKNGNLNIKPEVEEKLKQLINGYTPPASPAEMVSHGAYEDSAGNVYHLREMSDGKYLDDNDFEVDITHFKRR